MSDRSQPQMELTSPSEWFVCKLVVTIGRSVGLQEYRIQVQMALLSMHEPRRRGHVDGWFNCRDSGGSKFQERLWLVGEIDQDE